MAMRFRFDANQEYQLAAIAAVVDLFDGQPRVEIDLTGLALGGVLAVPNRLDLADGVLLANLKAVQQRQGLPESVELPMISGHADTPAGETPVQYANFSVEMETGTGKTYVYIRTALELYTRYGFRKFIIVVPSVAIREGVLKTLQITREHFRELYNNPPYRFYVYDSANLTQVRQFALSNGVEFMVMTLASFNKAANVVRQSTDRLQGETPIHLIQAARPILILDEPQNMEGEKSVAALTSLRPLFALRYSATHRTPYGLVHRLTPFQAYYQGLVKRIEVAGLEQVDDANLPYVRLVRLQSEKRTITATLAVHKLMKDGAIREQLVTVRPGECLERKANRREYDDFTVDEISLIGDYIRFTNGLELALGQATGAERAALWEAQIRYTVEEHFLKQRRLRKRGIKVLSLFFIDRVDNYARADGSIRRLFERCFDELKTDPRNADWAGVPVETVQAAYFAQRRTREGMVLFEDSRTGDSETDRAVYDLIMRDKERLLSFDEPVSFIFTHSALREGWDNPNVFQICTLNNTASEVKKRQEIGRGVRLAVDQAGERVRDEAVNILTVIANESYEDYVARLQSEFDQEYGPAQERPPVVNARRRGVSRLNKERFLSPEFAALFDRIKPKTRFRVEIDSGKLIADVVAALERETIASPRIAVTKVHVQIGIEQLVQALQLSSAKTVIDLAGRYPLPNLVALIEDLLERTTPPVRLSRDTLLAIYRSASDRLKQAALDNPHEFANVVVRLIREQLPKQMVSGIRYEKVNEFYEMSQFASEIQSWEDYLVEAERGVYRPAIVQSDVERAFVAQLEARDDVKAWAKLPAWFVVDTPLGPYNPDFAFVAQKVDAHGEPIGGELLYFVHETKGSDRTGDLREDERLKTECGACHFRNVGVDYKVGPMLRA